MKDPYGREIKYMRISITDRCNLRCKYCMPDGVQWIPMKEILSFEEIVLICQEAVRLGIHNFKITGGEPLVRKGCADLIRLMKGIDGINEVTLTTNGILLEENLDVLIASGLDAVNISLDTLDEKRYEQITGFPKLGNVLSAIEASVQKGLKTKINVVLQQGVNEEEWQNLAELARKYPVDVRFIELMPIGSGKESRRVSNVEILDRLRKAYPQKEIPETERPEEEHAGIVPDQRRHGNGPAVYYKIPGFQGSVGFISAIHGKFCDKCNRIRLTSVGELKPCLCYGERISLREAARNKDAAGVREKLAEAIDKKPQKHQFEVLHNVTEHKKMSQIGG